MSAPDRSLAAALADLRVIKQQIAAHPAPGFTARFAELRAWQSERVAAFHAERAARHDGHALLVFLTRRFYVEADWSELISRPERMAGAVDKIVVQDRPLVIAIELQTAAERLDMAMTETLIAEDWPLSAHSYIRAFRRVDARDIRMQQMAWLEELLDWVAGYADNRATAWAFKLARKPAHTLGLGRTYDFLAEGFSAMRTPPDLRAGVHDVIAAQRARLTRLLGDRDTF